MEARFGRGRGPLLLVVTWVPSGESHAGFLSPFPRSSLILKLPTWGRWITRLRQELGREISDMAVRGVASHDPPRRTPRFLPLPRPLTCTSPASAQEPGRLPGAVRVFLSSGLSVGGRACANQGHTSGQPGTRWPPSWPAGPRQCPSPLFLLHLLSKARGPDGLGVAATSRGRSQVSSGPSFLVLSHLSLCNHPFLGPSLPELQLLEGRSTKASVQWAECTNDTRSPVGRGICPDGSGPLGTGPQVGPWSGPCPWRPPRELTRTASC